MFKTQIIKVDKEYYIRKRCLFWWLYLDRADTCWWSSSEYVERYCTFNSLEEAEERLKEFSKKTLPVKPEIIKEI